MTHNEEEHTANVGTGQRRLAGCMCGGCTHTCAQITDVLLLDCIQYDVEHSRHIECEAGVGGQVALTLEKKFVVLREDLLVVTPGGVVRPPYCATI